MIKQARYQQAMLVLWILLSYSIGAQPTPQRVPAASAQHQPIAPLNSVDSVPQPPDIVQDIPLYAQDNLAARYRARSRSQVRANQAPPAKQATTKPVASWTQQDGLRLFSQMVKPAGVTLSQAMASIYLANPQAFQDSNPLKLKRGVKLTVPAVGVMLALTEDQANKLLRQSAGSPAPTPSEPVKPPSAVQPSPMTQPDASSAPSIASAPQAAQLDALEQTLAQRSATLNSANQRVQTLEGQVKLLQQQQQVAGMSYETLLIIALVAAAIGVVALLALLLVLLNKRTAKPSGAAPMPIAYSAGDDDDDEDLSSTTTSRTGGTFEHGDEAASALVKPDADTHAMAQLPADMTFPIEGAFDTPDFPEGLLAPLSDPAVASAASKPVSKPPPDLVVADRDTPVQPEPAETPDNLSAKGGDFLLDFDFALEPVAKMTTVPASLPAAAHTAANSMQDDMELDFSTELSPQDHDPASAKLDLARVYLDMGDKQGAREVLQNFLTTEPTGDLKVQAERMLADI